MTASLSISFIWEGDGFKPASPFWAKRADKEFVVGQRYEMAEVQERSQASHRAFFASVKAAWENLPEEMADRFPSADALRKYALVQSGHCNQDTFVCATKAEAVRLEAYLKPIDEYGVIVRRGSVITRYVAHSQSYRSMDKETFKRSFDDVLRVIADMLGTTAAEMSEAGKAA